MAPQMKSCRPKTPGGKAVMPESLSLALSFLVFLSLLSFSVSPHRPPKNDRHSFTLLSLFLIKARRCRALKRRV